MVSLDRFDLVGPGWDFVGSLWWDLSGGGGWSIQLGGCWVGSGPNRFELVGVE